MTAILFGIVGLVLVAKGFDYGFLLCFLGNIMAFKSLKIKVVTVK